jgi:hypothetical protein
MGNIIAYCGLVCNDCPAFIATENNDEAHKYRISQEWSRTGYNINPEEISCKGCSTGSETMFKFCKECKIRQCGIDKAIPNCAHCDGFPCSKIEDFFKDLPQNIEALYLIRKSL